MLVHGYHPFTEDGGLYAAGVFLKLDPSLFPRTGDFVRAPMHYSMFATWMAAVARVTHLSIEWVLLLADLATMWLMLFAAWELVRRCVRSDAAQLGGVALLAAWWTLPVAGTSLMLMDPYVTARSFSMPLSLLAVAFAMDAWRRLPLSRSTKTWLRHPALLCGACLVLAAVMHLLMAAYALALVGAVRACVTRRRGLAIAVLATGIFAASAWIQAAAPAESEAWRLAGITRYYWFLSQWHWYELAGLAGPLAILLWFFLRPPAWMTEKARLLCLSSVGAGTIALAVAVGFSRRGAATFAVARMQPLRVFLLLYAVMALLTGCAGVHAARKFAASVGVAWMRVFRMLPVLCVTALAGCMSFVQQQIYSSSPHLEVPWRTAANSNPWVQAFLWARGNTSRDALFAYDSHYISAPGEDAHTFRALALRDALADYSKDGGEASISQSLVPAWRTGEQAQRDLRILPDSVRVARLKPLGVDWLILEASAVTAFPCPYNNGAVKVCRLQG